MSKKKSHKKKSKLFTLKNTLKKNKKKIALAAAVTTTAAATYYYLKNNPKYARQTIPQNRKVDTQAEKVGTLFPHTHPSSSPTTSYTVPALLPPPPPPPRRVTIPHPICKSVTSLRIRCQRLGKMYKNILMKKYKKKLTYFKEKKLFSIYLIHTVLNNNSRRRKYKYTFELSPSSFIDVNVVNAVFPTDEQRENVDVINRITHKTFTMIGHLGSGVRNRAYLIEHMGKKSVLKIGVSKPDNNIYEISNHFTDKADKSIILFDESSYESNNTYYTLQSWVMPLTHLDSLRFIDDEDDDEDEDTAVQNIIELQMKTVLDMQEGLLYNNIIFMDLKFDNIGLYENKYDSTWHVRILDYDSLNISDINDFDNIIRTISLKNAVSWENKPLHTLLQKIKLDDVCKQSLLLPSKWVTCADRILRKLLLWIIDRSLQRKEPFFYFQGFNSTLPTLTLNYFKTHSIFTNANTICQDLALSILSSCQQKGL